MNEEAITPFKQHKETLIMCPPQAHLRIFNEHDVLGEVDRDEKCNTVILEDKQGRLHDKQRNPTN